MKVLVINVGSTSLKYDLFDMDTERGLAGGAVERLGSQAALHRYEVAGAKGEDPIDAPTVRAGLEAVLKTLGQAGALADLADLRAVGHRVVHGGEKLVAPTIVTPAVKDVIRRCTEFAPIHNPANLAGIEAAEEAMPGAVHVAVFDTA